MVASTRSQTRKLTGKISEITDMTLQSHHERKAVHSSHGTSSRSAQNITATKYKSKSSHPGTEAKNMLDSYSATKSNVCIKMGEPIVYQQAAMTPTKDTAYIVRDRPESNSSVIRRNKLRPSSRQRKKHTISLRTLHFMRSLRLPVLPSINEAWSLSMCLTYLRWNITLRPGSTKRFQPDIASVAIPACLPNKRWFSVPKRKITRRIAFKRTFGVKPSPAIPPNLSLGGPLEVERSRLSGRFRSGTFQISTNWRPLRDIPRGKLYGHRQGTVDSDPWGNRNTDGADEAFEALQKRQDDDLQERIRQALIILAQRPASASGSDDGAASSSSTAREDAQGSSALVTPRSSDGASRETSSPAHANAHVGLAESGLRNGGSVGPSVSATSSQHALSNVENSRSEASTVRPRDVEATKRRQATDLIFKPSVIFKSSVSEGLSLANDWEMLIAMQQNHLRWTYQDDPGVKIRDVKRHAGVFDAVESSETSRDIGNRTSRAIASLLLLRPQDLHEWNEAGFRSVVAGLFADVWSRDDIRAHCSYKVDYPPALWSSPHPIILDVACVLTNEASVYNLRGPLVLMAAQYCKDSERRAAELLASAFHATLIIMILYFLDTRLTIEDTLPTWMVLYGVLYDENGIAIQEFYPIYRDAEQPAQIGWGAASHLVTVSTLDIFTEGNGDRGRLISALLRISSRAHNISRRLAQWDGYERLVIRRFFPEKRHSPSNG